jgi:hypothetical protein
MMALLMAHRSVSTTGQKLEVKLEYQKSKVLRWAMQTEVSLDDQKSAGRKEF